MLALKMCLIDSEARFFDFSPLSQSLIFREQALLAGLSQVKARYSAPLSALLVKMLKASPQDRSNFSEIIDELNPILLLNLQAIKDLHLPKREPSSKKESARVEGPAKAVLR